MKKLMFVANWKMNKNKKEAKEFLAEFLPKVKQVKHKIVIAPSFTLLDEVNKKLTKTRVKLASQDMFFSNYGAFTGEVSPNMLKDFKTQYVILGHSERRKYFLESDEFVNKKVLCALKENLKPIICVGETLEEREKGDYKQQIQNQVTLALNKVEYKDLKNLVFAYEPVWAIGSGKAIKPSQAQAMAEIINQTVENIFDTPINLNLLYGGSVNSQNVNNFLKQKHINGVLVGGASLNAQSFSDLILGAKDE